jgi:lipopolysaccharide export system protein LptC
MPESILPSPRKLGALAGVGLAAFGATYLALTEPDSATRLLARSTGANRIDLYVEQPHINKFNEKGRLIETLTAARMEHQLNSNQSQLSEPRFHVYTGQGTVWNGSAASATVLGDREVRLRDKVVIVDAPGTQRLTTEALDYFPKEERVSSAVLVTLRRPTDTTRARGVRADLNTNRVELLSRVEGVHVAP